jgi:hypothetical protein
VADGSIYSDRDEICRAFEIYIAARFGQLMTNAVYNGFPGVIAISPDQRVEGERLVKIHPVLSEAELTQAASTVELFLNERNSGVGTEKRPPYQKSIAGPRFFALTSIFSLAVYVGIPSLVTALLFRGGLIFRVLGIAVVQKNGRRASRLRMLWRAIITWGPVFVLGWVALAQAFHEASALNLIFIFAFLVLALVSTLLPHRGLQDRLAGTWLVPR